MTVDLDKLHDRIFLKIFASFLFVVAVTTGASWYLLEISGIEDSVVFIATAFTGLLLTTFFSWLVSKESMVATTYLAQAILHVAKGSSVEAPSTKHLAKNQRFLDDLANRVYDLASSGGAVPSSAPSISSGDLPSLDQLGVPAVAMDSNNNVVFSNSAAGVYFSFNQKEAIGKSLYDLLHFSFTNHNTLDQWLADCRENKVTASQSWERVRHKISTDSLRQFDMVGHFSKDNPNGYDTLLIFIDHTSRYSQEDQDVGYVAMAVHELRTPLTVLRGYIEVLGDEIQNLNEEQKEFMHNMNAQAQQLSDFVSNILDVARIEENQLAMHLKEADWGEVLRKSVSDMELRARVRGLSITTVIAPDLPTVAIDKVSAYEVINNLIDNAIKYTHTDQSIEVNTYQKDENWVETTITDHGVGIPDNVIGHLFQKFYRSHKSSNATVGTGIGLYLSKAIVNAHGGEIWVKSKEGSGSTFGFTMPTYKSVAKDVDSDDNGIVRETHGWIKNHSLYRG